MKYYTIQNKGLLIADNKQALTKFYNNVLPLPRDYEDGKYIVVDGELVLNPNYEEEKLLKAKETKYKEALDKAYDYQENGTVEYKNCMFEMSKANRDNLRDTVEALTLMGQTETTWNDKNDELVTLTIEDIQYIRLNLILGAIQKLWIEDYPAYKTLIAEASTTSDVNAIDIIYPRIEEEEEPIENTTDTDVSA